MAIVLDNDGFPAVTATDRAPGALARRAPPPSSSRPGEGRGPSRRSGASGGAAPRRRVVLDVGAGVRDPARRQLALERPAVRRRRSRPDVRSSMRCIPPRARAARGDDARRGGAPTTSALADATSSRTRAGSRRRATVCGRRGSP